MGRAQKKEERQEILRQLFEEKREEQLRKNMVVLLAPVPWAALLVFPEASSACSFTNLALFCLGFKCVCKEY